MTEETMTMAEADRLRLVVICPHFEPDTAPTGAVMTRLVHELADLGHEIHVVTSLPWYREHRVEDPWSQVKWSTRTTDTGWGSITRLNPFAGSDKRNVLRRALGFFGFTLTSTVAALVIARRSRCNAVLAMSPPLTLGFGARIVALVRRAPMILNIQDVFPDAAIETGVISNRSVIRVARLLERWTYRVSTAVTVLSEDLGDNVREKISSRRHDKVVVIPNFVDTQSIVPLDRMTSYRSELGLGDRLVVMYSGNIGFSQSLHLLVDAARTFPDVMFVVNGDGSERRRLQRESAGVANVVFGEFQPAERLAEVLCTADLHVVPLHAGLGRVSVPSKTYSILAAGRPILASIDPDTEVPRLLASSGAGISVPPDDLAAFVDGLQELLSNPEILGDMGRKGRQFVESAASPRAVAGLYADLIQECRARRSRNSLEIGAGPAAEGDRSFRNGG